MPEAFVGYHDVIVGKLVCMIFEFYRYQIGASFCDIIVWLIHHLCIRWFKTLSGTMVSWNCHVVFSLDDIVWITKKEEINVECCWILCIYIYILYIVKDCYIMHYDEIPWSMAKMRYHWNMAKQKIHLCINISMLIWWLKRLWCCWICDKYT